MAEFTVRVGLHNASSDDYKRLHLAMWLRRFRHWFVGTDGRFWKLPTATYHYSGLSCETVQALVEEACAGVSKNLTITVEETVNRSFSGLKEIRPPHLILPIVRKQHG